MFSLECGCAEEIRPESIEEEKMMRITIAKGCLYCGLRLPEYADFCPECGRPLEVIRVDSEAKMMRTTIARGCPHCGLQLPDSVDFCPECGRPIEKGRVTDASQESEADCPDTEIEGKDDLIRQQEASSDCSDPLTHETTRIRDEHEHVNLIGTPMIVAKIIQVPFSCRIMVL
jgi:RNA polymerase subunit RPABC4/transcription elongation factor Spt4